MSTKKFLNNGNTSQSNEKYSLLCSVHSDNLRTILDTQESYLLKSIGFEVPRHITFAQERRDRERKRHWTQKCKKKGKTAEDMEQEMLTGRKKRLRESTSYQVREH